MQSILIGDLPTVKNGNYHQAIEDFNKAIELNQKEAEAYYNEGLPMVILATIIKLLWIIARSLK